MADGPVALVTGATSGIGRAAAVRLAGSGWTVFGAGRSADVAAIEQAAQDGIRLLRLDVRDDDSVAQGVRDVTALTGGRIDALVSNAGINFTGSAEGTGMDDVLDVFQTNLFGGIRMCRAVLPYMRAQGRGRIILTGSLGGLVGLPYHSSYSSSKAAVRTFVQSLRSEVGPLGIHAMVIEPGDVNTGTTALRSRSVADEDPAYAQALAKARAAMIHGEEEGVSPEDVANVIVRALTVSRPKARYTVAPALQRLLGPARRILPEPVLVSLVHSFYR